MAAPDGRSESDQHLFVAAQAAASWVRARRSTWTDEPLPLPVVEPAPEEAPPAVVGPPPVVEPPPPIVQPPARAVEPPAQVVELPPRVVEPPRPVIIPPRFVEPEPEVEPPPAVEVPTRAFARAEAEASAAERPPIGRWVGIAAAGIAIVAAGVVGVPYLWRARPSPSTHPTALPSTPAPETRPATPPRPAGGQKSSAGTAAPARGAAPAKAAPAAGRTGDLRVASTPPGARVFLDGKPRGVTPLTLSGVSVGTHEVTITSDAGSVRRSVSVDAGEASEVDESIFPGWVAVLAPFDVEISENGRALRADDRGQVLLPPGPHDLRLVNRSLSYASVQHVEVKPGATTPVRVAAPSSTLTVTSSSPGEVWLDGARVGPTPLTAYPVALGTHEVVVRRPGGDKRFTITVGTTPITLNADTGR